MSTEPMRITDLTAVPVRVPLSHPYVLSRGAMHAFDSVIVRVTVADGRVGYGESVPLSVVGDPLALAALLEGPVRAAVIGKDARDVEPLVDAAFAAAGTALDAVAGLDLALWDLLGHDLGLPAHKLLGGLAQARIPVDYTIGAAAPADMANVAREVVAGGFRGVVVKVPCARVADDVARVRAVREAVPSDITVRVDCNAGYARDDAHAFLRAVGDFGLEFVEQPVAGTDLEGMRSCRVFGVRISADESLNSPADALALLRAEACDVMNVKVPKVGGLVASKRIAAIAGAAGVPVVVGGRTTLELSRAASRHFAASTAGAGDIAHEGPGPASQALADDVVARRTTRADVAENGGAVFVETSPGLGYDVSWTTVARYRITAGPGEGR